MRKKTKLSITVITLNEEKFIKKCLSSVNEIADEIVVVDSGSTDKTVKIAKAFGARVYVKKFDNYSNQKNYAAGKATGKWILSLDADEKIEAKLAGEIVNAIRSDKFDAYSIPRKNIIFGRFIKFTRWQPELDRHIWLWRKTIGEWVGDVHEEVVVKGKVGRLNNAKVHYQYETVREFIQMMDEYSEREATERVKKGIRFSHWRMKFDCVYNFLVRYFYRLGFLDGWRGFVLSFLMGVYHIILWMKIWEKQT